MRRLYYILSAILLAVLATLMCIYDKGTLHLMLCDHHTAAGDVFFPVYTQVAEWGIYVVAVLLMLYKFGWGCFLLVSNWVAGGIGQIIKHIAQAPRPVTWFAQHYPDVQLPAIEGIEFKEWNSFPSGHTITFFCLFLVLTMVIEELYHTAKRSYSEAVFQRQRSFSVSGLSAAGGLFALATLGAYSRIYMSMHFAEDIFAGIILGVGITALLSLFIPKLSNTRFWNANLHSSIFNHNCSN